MYRAETPAHPEQNPKSEAPNPKQTMIKHTQTEKIQNANPDCLEHCPFDHLKLFRISDFEFGALSVFVRALGVSDSRARRSSAVTHAKTKCVLRHVHIVEHHVGLSAAPRSEPIEVRIRVAVFVTADAV
jgi:hypothetical protein